MFCGQFGETMGSSKKNTKASNLTSLPGVGAASAKKLVDAKLDTISKVAAAGTTKLVKAGIQAALAKKIAAAAKKEYPSAYINEGKVMIVIPAKVAAVAEKKNTQDEILLSAK